MSYLHRKFHSCRKLIVLFLLLFSVQAWAVPATCTWDDGWDQEPVAGDHIVIAGGDLTWDTSLPDTVGSWTQAETYGGVVTFHTVYGDTGFIQFIITGDATINGGAWTHPENSSAAVHRLSVKVEGNLTVGSGGEINADGKGHDSNEGPGVGGTNRDGGSHGGKGADRLYTQTSGPTYGLVTSPITLGSGGRAGTGGSSGPGGRGGGAIFADVSGVAMIEGKVSANGKTPDLSAGGGAGGSVCIETGSLDGSGFIEAIGGNTPGSGEGSGGGGRIAIVQRTGTEWGPIVRAFGGSTGRTASAGTVYLQDGTQETGRGELIVDNNGVQTANGWNSTELSATGDNLSNFSRVTIRNHGNLSVRENDTLDFSQATITGDSSGTAFLNIRDAANVTFPATFVLDGNYTLNLDTPISTTGDWTIKSGSALSHSRNHNAETYKLDLTLAGDLTVEAGGEINADEKGYAENQGPGSRNTREGGSHGGKAGYRYDTDGFNSRTYGSATNPVSMGAGGVAGTGGSGGPGRRGGGAIIVAASGTVTVDGMITANGGTVVGHSAGAGAGGSVNINAKHLTGSGKILALGGNVGTSSDGSGGGGRIAVIQTAGAGWPPAIPVQAFGGTTHNTGGAGTIYLETAADAPGGGKLIIRNTHTTAARALTELPASHETLSYPDELQRATLIIEDKGKARLTADITVGDLIVRD